jgi:hypothetical protein
MISRKSAHVAHPKANNAPRIARTYMPSIISVWLSNHVFLVPLVLIGGDALATIVVGWGIIWEGPGQSAERHRIAARLVIVGIAAETIFSLGLFAFDESISHSQQDKIIALETKLAPRSLSALDIADIGKHLAAYAGQKYLGSVSAGVADGCPLWGQINAALSVARWQRVPVSDTFSMGCDPRAESPTFPNMGVIVFSQKAAGEATAHAAEALTKALSDKFVARHETVEYNTSGTAINDPAVIVIEFGIKP